MKYKTYTQRVMNATAEQRKALPAPGAGGKAAGAAKGGAAGVMGTKARAPAFQHSKTPTGIPASLENAIRAIAALNIECSYDEYHDRIIVKGCATEIGGDVLENLENVTLKVRQEVLAQFGFDPSSGFTFDALKMHCLEHIFDPVRDYLDGVVWDGVARLDGWLIRYCGADDTPLNRAIGRKVLMAAVRRVRQPGCKFDYILVLEGSQGAGKSTLLKLLAGEENFSDNEILGLDKREQQEAIQGIWIYEIAELEGLSRSEVTKIKLFASKTVDAARPAYARTRVDRKRRGIFVATTNEDTYLRDTTGNRRFWPVKLPEGQMIDLPSVARDRDQLWAEAVLAEATGEPLVIPEALWPDAAAEQAARMELDPWEDIIAPKLAGLVGTGADVGDSFAAAADRRGDPEWRIASEWLLTSALGLPKDRQNNNHTKRLAAVMRGLGWKLSEKTIRIGGKVGRGYTKPAAPEEAAAAPSPPKPRLITAVATTKRPTVAPAAPATEVPAPLALPRPFSRRGL